MTLIVKNNHGKEVFLADIPNTSTLRWFKDQEIDLDNLTSRDLIRQSRHFRVHLLEGRLAITSASPAFDPFDGSELDRS